MPAWGAAGNSGCLGGKVGEVVVPPRRKFAALHLVDLATEFGILFSVVGEEVPPATSRFGATLACSGTDVLSTAVGNKKPGVLGPSVKAFAEATFIVAERFVMGRGRVLFVRRATGS